MNSMRTGRMIASRCLPILVAFLALMGCAISPSPNLTPEATPASPSPANETDPLANTIWQLIAMGDSASTVPVVAGSTVTLEFSADGQAGGEGGCNSYGGEYTVQEDTISFGEIVSTLMACADQSVTEQEQQYLAALRNAERFAIDGDQLTIWYDNGTGMLTFTAAAVAPGIPTTAAPTETPSVLSPPLPTATAEPPASNGDSTNEEATRIRFGPGETSAELNGSIAERATDFYVLQAQQGQIMSVEITSPNSDVLLTVVGEDGIPLKRYQNGPPSWTSQLPATQDYFIHAVSVGPATDYTLRVWVEPLGDSSAERVEFAPGETSATRSGALPESGVKEYVLAASAGQMMHVQTVGYGAPVEFTVRSPGGATWSGEAQGSEVYIFTAQMILPKDGDYVVTLSVPAAAGATRYNVAFTIDAGAMPTPPVPSEPPERVEFAPGATSAERGGLLPSGPGITQYVLAANEGQTMTVDATSDGTPLSMTIESPSGMRWIPEMRPIENGYAIGIEFVLPATGDYVVTLGKADHTPSTNYSVMFAIQ